MIVQDVRGRGTSSGVWKPYLNEIEDGVLTLDWAAKQPWTNGQFHLFGESYGAFTALSIAANAAPGAVTSCAALAPATGLWETAFHRSGAFKLYDRVWWDSLLAKHEADLSCTAIASELAALLWHLPPVDIPTLCPTSLQSFSQIATMARPPRLALERITCPLMIVSGWHDCFLEQAIDLFLQATAAPRELVIGPWDHDLVPAHVTLPNSRGIVSSWYQKEAWRDVCAANIRAYVPDRLCWVEWRSWPPPSSSFTLYLSDPVDGDIGSLSLEPPQALSRRGWRCDPYDPYPSSPQQLNRELLLRRKDAIFYETRPFEKHMTFVGTASVTLFLTTTAPQTEIHCVICRVLADGWTARIASGIARVEPNSDQPIKILLSPVCLQFAIGERLRIEISSGAFPEFARHPNTVEDALIATELFSSWQVVHHSPAAASNISFPLLDVGTESESRPS